MRVFPSLNTWRRGLQKTLLEKGFVPFMYSLGGMFGGGHWEGLEGLNSGHQAWMQCPDPLSHPTGPVGILRVD